MTEIKLSENTILLIVGICIGIIACVGIFMSTVSQSTPNNEPVYFTFIKSDISYSDVVNLTCEEPPWSAFSGVKTNVCLIENSSQYSTEWIQWGEGAGASHLLVRTDYKNTISAGCVWESRNYGEKWTISYNNPFQGERCDILYRTRGYLPNNDSIPLNTKVSEIKVQNWGW